MFIKQIAVLLVSLAVACLAYPDGAPDSVCDTMSPNHNNTADTDPSPYTIVIDTPNPTTVGSPISGHINCNDATTLRGFMIKALTDSTDAKTTAVTGTFTIGDEEKANIKAMNCSEIVGTAITHTNNTDKACKDIKFTWMTDTEQTVYFRATVVYNVSVFWVNIVSDAVIVTAAATTKAPDTTTTGAATTKAPATATTAAATTKAPATATTAAATTKAPATATGSTSGEMTTSNNVTTTTPITTTGAAGLSVSLMAFLFILTSSWFTSKMF